LSGISSRARHTLDCQTGVVLRIGSSVINVSGTTRAAEFWNAALGYTVQGGTVPEDGSAVLRSSLVGGPAITLDGDDRMHLDLHVDSKDELAAEVGRLVNLGARRVTGPTRTEQGSWSSLTRRGTFSA
jgi:hypothetical protein